VLCLEREPSWSFSPPRTPAVTSAKPPDGNAASKPGANAQVKRQDQAIPLIWRTQLLS
jgi:hypothetical protein